MNNSTEKLQDAIAGWKKDNKLTRKAQVLPLLEAYRRVYLKGSREDFKMLLLAFPSEVKEIKGKYVKPYNIETKRASNWYDLTEEGIKVIKDLQVRVGEFTNEMNQYLFKLS